MATADELREQIAEARAAFQTALEGAAGGWEEQPEGDEWTRRQTAEHAIGVDYAFAGWAVSLTGGEEASIERTDPSLASAAEALEAFAASSAHSDTLWAGVTAEHLEQELRPEMSGERGMSMVGMHLQEHAQQISAS